MRFLYRLIVFITLPSCLLTGCCHLCECRKQEPLPIVNTAVQEKHDLPSSLYTVSDKYTYKHGNNVNGTVRETFLVIDTSNVDPPPVRSKPKTFVNVPVSRFHRHKSKHNTIIYFDLNSYRIRKTEIEKLENFARQQNGENVSVTGYTCWKGTQKHNDIIAMKRARSVAEYLKKMGVVVRSVTGKGKSRYKSRTNIALNRRVVIMSCTKKSF